MKSHKFNWSKYMRILCTQRHPHITHTRTCTHTRAHMHTHTRTHTYTHTHTYPHTHAHTHTHTQDLSLDFVFGYRGFDTRQNLLYGQDGSVIYHAAAAGIVYNPLTKKQSFYLEHNDDIICLALNPNAKLNQVVATGQRPSFLEFDWLHSSEVSLLLFASLDHVQSFQ